MASSQGVNVLRYSALAAGVVYGLYHQSSLNSQAKVARIDHEYSRKESLIKQAKEEWQKKNSPPQPKTEGVITDFDDKRFDLEAFIKMKAGEK